MNQKIKKLLAKYRCLPGKVFSYNASTKTITYIPELLETDDGLLAFLHEIAHLQLNHFSYKYDVELLGIEVEAWELTKKLAQEMKIKINENHIRECLRSYDCWISKRAACPKCGAYSLQRTQNVFGCFVCDCYWKVNDRKDREVRKKIFPKKSG